MADKDAVRDEIQAAAEKVQEIRDTLKRSGKGGS